MQFVTLQTPDSLIQWLVISVDFRKRLFDQIGNFISHDQWLAIILTTAILGPVLLLIYINDLSHAIKYCKVHHFADDTNLLHCNSSTKKLNRLVTLDMKHLSVWLNANKISLNVQKTELVIFKQKRKILDHETWNKY